MTVQLAHAAWPELRGGDLVLLVPVGATEQHGPHLPLGTDTELAVAVADRAASRRDGIVVAPAIAYGSSGEHAGFAGTLSIGRGATEQLLVELCRSATATFRRVILVCAHGGNAEPVSSAVSRLRAEGRDVGAFVPDWGGDAHAGRTETSLMLAVAPGLVRSERAEPGNTQPLGRLIGALRAQGVAGVSRNGILGDPAGACAADGEAILERAVQSLLAQLQG